MCRQWQPLAADSLAAALLLGLVVLPALRTCYLCLHSTRGQLTGPLSSPLPPHTAALPALPHHPPGLPEEVLIIRTALARFYAVVAISSRDRVHRRCWAVPHQPGTHSVDTLSVGGHAQQQLHRLAFPPLCHNSPPSNVCPLLVCQSKSADCCAECCVMLCCADLTRQVATVVAELQKRHQSLRGLPLYAVGASSGGAFALTLTAYLPFSGVTGCCWLRDNRVWS